MIKFLKNQSRQHLVIGGLALLAIVLGIVIATGQGSEDPVVDPGPVAVQPVDDSGPAEAPETEPEDTAEPPAEMTPEPEPTANNPSLRDDDNLLPANWEQLSEAEKIAANPYGCQPDSQGQVRLNFETGECQTASGNDDDSQTAEPPAQQTPPATQPPATPGQTMVELNQKFSVNAGGLELEVVATEFRCYRPDQQPPGGGWGRGESGPLTTDPGPAETMIAQQQLSGFKQCLAKFRATNVGDNWTFSDACRLDDFDRFVKAKNTRQNRTHRPFDWSGGLFCAQVVTPFPTGDSTETRVFFSLPLNEEVDALVIDNGQSGTVLVSGLDSSV